MTRRFADELVGPSTGGLPERFFDRFMFNLHRTDATSPSIIVGAGIYPGRNVIDGFAIVTTATEQRNLRFSTELDATDGRAVGPLSWRVEEPMQRWHLVLAPNATGLEFDVEWEARAPAWFGDVTVRDGEAIVSSFEHLFQSGTYSGTATMDGTALDVGGWLGQRDRSRGVRTMSGGQGLHLWFQAQFTDRAIGFLLVEDRDHGRLLLEGAVMHTDGVLDPIAEVRHDLSFSDQLDLVGGTVEVTTSRGMIYVVDVDATAGGGYMSGGGYGGQHGHPRGRNFVEHDVYPLDGSVTPKTVDSALTDRLATFNWDGNPGIGIFEFAHSRSASYIYRPSPGFRELPGRSIEGNQS
jgi:hypothetical protein